MYMYLYVMVYYKTLLYNCFLYISEADQRCPVKTFVKYKRMLPMGYDCLFPKVRKTISKEGLWFDRAPTGHNKLGNMMANLSEKAGLSRRYTNHSLRATSVHLLDSANIPTRHIMTVTGHKAESSLKTYTGYTDSKSKRTMSNTISKATGIQIEQCDENQPPVNSSECDLNDIQVDFNNVDFKPLTNSQQNNILSMFDESVFDDEFDDIIRNNYMSDNSSNSLVHVPAVSGGLDTNTCKSKCHTNTGNVMKNRNFSQSRNITTDINMHNMQIPTLPAINANTCNIVVNYNIYQK